MNATNNINILIVEDEAITAMDIKRRLEQLGYNVPGTASSGKEAISLAEQLKPNLILMDIILKGEMDGTEAAQLISQNFYIPIVFLTAYNDDDTFNRAKLSRPYGYLTKPFETREMRIAVELALFKYDTDIKISKAEKRYRSVMENATCGIFISDKNANIFDLNKQAEIIFGSEYKEIIGTDFKELVQESEQEYAEIQLQKVLIDKSIGPIEWHIKQPDGKIRNVEFTAVYIDNKDESFIFSILNDVTERNKLRAQTLLSDKLAAVGTLTAGIIHEINNPMSYVLTNLHYINKKLKSIKLDDVQQNNFITSLNEIVNESIAGAERIQEIVADLKGFVRVDIEELTSVDINEVLNSAINMALPQFKNYASIDKEFTVDLPQLLLSSSKLHQVFLNLIINAAQAMDQNSIKTNVIHVKTFMENKHICISITDTGKGIPPDILPNIFDPFFTTKPIGVGTGLGLSICYEIIHGLGGEIIVDSHVGKGTTFSIYLPTNLIAENLNSKLIDNQKNSGKKILIINNEPSLLITLEKILTEDNYVTKAEGGKAAFDLLAKNEEQYDVIVSEVNMPDLNGGDLYRYLVENNPTLANHTVFTSDGLCDPSVTKFLSSIKNPCLEKPFTKVQLLQAIRTVLEDIK